MSCSQEECLIYDREFNSLSLQKVNSVVTITFFYVGSTQPFETLELAVCVAAKCGAMQFIKTVFSSKAGRAICTKNPLLPQLAREHGYEEIANYLEELTTR